ncbi:hypothetical protein [Marinobacter sp. SS13-12]|uniref:hypothetical protein n=1 Tax=Marinobacter sp. SS13-12 TaxID=3050451 RepID=UPI00255497EF|nr:hypothetical protein [Marinobacter sp. SS13-12]MDK8465259.1 hypothetical protein [Marinobacter sp. SS13-12]
MLRAFLFGAVESFDRFTMGVNATASLLQKVFNNAWQEKAIDDFLHIYLSLSAFEELSVSCGNVAVAFCVAMLPLPNHCYI